MIAITSPIENVAFDWLVRLRWSAIVGQAVLFIGLPQALGLNLPGTSLLIILVFSCCSNALFQFGSLQLRSRKIIQGILLLDIMLLSGLLYFSGGGSNPFSILYLIYVVIGAIILGEIWAWRLAAVSSLMFGLLFFWYQPVGELEHHSHSVLINTHLFGMLLSFFLTAFLLAYFQARIARALQVREEEINALRIKTEKRNRLAALTTVAAGAAHELGTPLSTIALVAEELKRDAEKEGLGTADLLLISNEVERCRSILQRLNLQSGQLIGEMPERFTIDRLLGQISEIFGSRINLQLGVNKLENLTLYLPYAGLLQTTKALIQNAIEAQQRSTPVQVAVAADEDRVVLRVIDSGCGMDEMQLSRLGEPFFSTKPAGSGMGLGIFLAKLFAEQTQGSLEFQSLNGQGTIAVLKLPMNIQQMVSIQCRSF